MSSDDKPILEWIEEQQKATRRTVAEVDAAERVTKQPLEADPMLQWFEYEHLPPHLQLVSAPYCILAHRIVQNLPRNAERTVSLRKLLEAKDAGVRAKLSKP
jgi:hypothetical protein